MLKNQKTLKKYKKILEKDFQNQKILKKTKILKKIQITLCVCNIN